MLTRLRTEEPGFGLVELLIAMLVLNVGILATIAAFNSGAIALKRAGQLSTAATIADAQMERFRAVRYEEIGLDATAAAAADADQTYVSDAARQYPDAMLTHSCPLDVDGEPVHCNPSRTVAGPDGRSYRVDVYIFEAPPTATVSRDVKIVTIVVRDASDLSRTFVRAQSTFDQSTGS